jgi:ferredoxin
MAVKAMPEIKEELCVGCGDCVSACPQGALSLSEAARIVLNEETCQYCGDCEDVCPVGVIALPFEIVLSTPMDQEGA